MRYQDDNLDVQKVITTLQERRNILQARLNSWFRIQAFYIPVAQELRVSQHGEGVGTRGHDEELEDAVRSSTDIVAEKVKLFLPSQIPPNLWSTGSILGLHELELKMRLAQTSDALENLKQQLCVYSGFVHFKIKHVSGPGQKANTRARNLLVRLREKITQCAERYRASRAALETLDLTGDWRGRFKPLLASDIQGPNGASPDDMVAAMSKRSKRRKGTGEGLRELSWIWRVRRTASEGITEADLDKCEFSFLNAFLHTLNPIDHNRSQSGICEIKSESRSLARRNLTSCGRNATNDILPAVESSLVEESSGAPHLH